MVVFICLCVTTWGLSSYATFTRGLAEPLSDMQLAVEM